MKGFVIHLKNKLPVDRDIMDHFGWKDGQKLTDDMFRQYITYRLDTIVERIEAKAQARFQVKPANR